MEKQTNKSNMKNKNSNNSVSITILTLNMLNYSSTLTSHQNTWIPGYVNTMIKDYLEKLNPG